MNKKDFWIGMGIGIGVGCTAGTIVSYSVAKKHVKKKMVSECDERVRKARKSSYDKAVAEAKEWIDNYRKEIESNMITVDTSDPEGARKVLDTFIEAKNSSVREEISEENDENDQKEPEKPLESEKIESYSDIPGVLDAKEPENNTENASGLSNTNRLTLTQSGMVKIALDALGHWVEYPQELFYDERGYMMGETRIRANLIDFEKNHETLKKVWKAMNWGEYYPNGIVEDITDEELYNMDVEIDKNLGSEPEEKTIERQIYMDKVDNYRDNPVNNPKIVSRRRFEEDCFLEHEYIDYYDVDNKFVNSTDITKEIDAVTMFGVSDGKELFKYKMKHPFDPDDDDNDPAIVHVENMFFNAIYEITRYHKSWEGVKDGSAYFTDSN